MRHTLQQAFGGRFEWLLWGDDDTMWFMPALQQLVAGLDPKTPYLVSGEHVSFITLPISLQESFWHMAHGAWLAQYHCRSVLS